MNKTAGPSVPPPAARPWISRTVAAIVLATFFSDFSHEMCTAVLPLYLGTVGLGPAALGLIEGAADLLGSMARLAGGVVGHHVEKKRPWVSLGYLVTTLATSGIALVRGLGALLWLRSLAWIARGFRGPLRDYLLADAVEPAYYGRAFGLERAGDMLGAVAGPLVAGLLVWLGLEFGPIILWSMLPGVLAAGAMFFFTREREYAPNPTPQEDYPTGAARPALPKVFWVFLVGVSLFGLGDFSRTFLIWLAVKAMGEDSGMGSANLSVAVMLYTAHNLVSAVVAYPVGHLGDKRSKLSMLVVGFALGVGTNLLLAIAWDALGGLVAAILLSGIYIAVQETLQKAVAAELLPRVRRSLGFGILAAANAVGDMASSFYVGYLLQVGQFAVAFGIAAAFGLSGMAWMSRFLIAGPLQREP
jgi:MFS family permease